jgi:ubiquinone/menaquinone biosynthesis C-methylase UbiE
MATDEVPENLKDRLKETYDIIAPKYNEWTIPHSEQRYKYLDKLLAFLPVPTADESNDKVSILELGAGCGLPVTKKLLSHNANFHVTANDLSSVQMDLARQNLADPKFKGRVQFMEGDMMGLSFEGRSLDAVVGMYSLIHLPRQEQAVLLNRIVGWLKPGGYLLANFSEAELKHVVMEQWLDEKGWAYWSGYGVEGTLEKVREAGLLVRVSEVAEDAVDASFLWVVAQKA